MFKISEIELKALAVLVELGYMIKLPDSDITLYRPYASGAFFVSVLEGYDNYEELGRFDSASEAIQVAIMKVK